MDISQDLEAAIGAGPPLPEPAARLVAGRRALRRRRAAAAGAALALVAVTGGTAWAVAGGGSQAVRGEGMVAVDPPPPPGPDREAAVDAFVADEPLRYVDGELQVDPAVVVHQHVENPLAYGRPRRSDALDVTFERHRMWVLGTLGGTGSGFSVVEPGVGAATFEQWIADQTARTPDGAGWPDTLTLTPEGTVVASEGSEVLQRTDEPRLGPDFAAPDTPTGAALVRAAEDGVGYFVVWRVVDGDLDVITVPPGDVVGATFQELLTYARAQYAGGEGLR